MEELERNSITDFLVPDKAIKSEVALTISTRDLIRLLVLSLGIAITWFGIKFIFSK